MLQLLLILPVLIIVYYYYRTTVPDLSQNRKRLLTGLRFLTIVVLLLLLFNPILNLRRNISFYPTIVFLNDNSHSMELTSGDNSKAEVFSKARDILAQISENNDYQTLDFHFADGIDGERTTANLSNTLQDLSQSVDFQHVEKIFLLSDGWFSDEQMDIVNRFNIPISTVHPDYETDDFDLGINRLIYNQTAYTEEEISIIADVFADDYAGRGEVKLFLKEDLIDTQEVDFDEGAVRQVTFNHVFKDSGLHPLRVEIATVDHDEEEINLTNNEYPGAIRVRDKRTGTYILTDKLLWDVRFVNNALTRDDRKDVSVFVNRDNRLYQGREVVEIQDILAEHLQLLVIINYGDLHLTGDQVELIERFVSNGGGLFVIGKPKASLQELIAATDIGIDRLFRTTLSLTQESNRYQTFSAIDDGEIPPIEHFYVDAMVHPQVLARFNNDEQSPAIIYNEYKQGRVVYMPFFNLWRWQLRAEGDNYNNFIDNLSAWLSNPEGADFFAQPDKNSYFLGETVTINLTALDETLSIHPNLNPKLQVMDDEENIVREDFMSFDNRYYTINIPRLPAGEYSFVINEETIDESAQGSFIVSTIGADGRNRGYNYPLLSFIARQTGGQILPYDAVDDFSIDSATRKTEQVTYEIPLYRHWLIISLFLVSFCLELYLRKRWGLL